jgi:uncharacterized protein (TIGR00369 family)
MCGGAVPHNLALGLRAVDCAPSIAVLELPYSESLVGDPERGVLHGGVVTTLLDATAGTAVYLSGKVPPRIATLDLRIDYLKPALPHRSVFARAECFKVTESIAFVRAIAYQDAEADAIASAAATFMLFRSESLYKGER